MTAPIVVAIVPARDRADTVGATVRALRGLAEITRVVVVDDGSSDDTAGVAATAGARVERLARNVGKGGAVSAGLVVAPEADVYVLIDADVGETASEAHALLEPLLADAADMVIGVLPGAGTRGGFGAVKRLAAAGIRRATHFEPSAPLSGQRAIRGELLRSLRLADRFGLETALTIDALRSGARVLEVDVAMDHRHTGRRLAGFRHRASQGNDITRALWPRLTSRRSRVALLLAVFVVASGIAFSSGARADPASVAATQHAAKVLLFGFPHMSLGDLGTGRTPNLDHLASRGAVAAMSVRTLSGRPSTTEGYATLGAGVRVKADDQGGLALDSAAGIEGDTASAALRRRTGVDVTSAAVAVVGGPATVLQNQGDHLSSAPGELGAALAAAGKRTAVIGNADTGYAYGGRASLLRPAAIALMDRAGAVYEGAVGRELLEADAGAPFGYRADRAQIASRASQALARADVVLVDPGDLDRASAFAALAEPRMADRARLDALRSTDDILGDVVRDLPKDTLLLIISVVPPSDEWRLTPIVASGAGVTRGYLHSPSTRRLGVVTLTDVAPSVLASLGAAVPDAMNGQPLRYHAGAGDLASLRRTDRDAAFRERIYFPLTMTFIVVQAIVYALAVVGFSRFGGVGRIGGPLRALALAIGAYPLATFLLRAVPNVAVLGSGGGVAVLLAIIAAIVLLALRAKRHALSPFAWVLFATIALLSADVATGARLQTSSLLGYSLHTAARFTGLGNTAFATLAATVILFGAIHVHHAPRRDEAVLTVACLFGFAVVIDGAPGLGSDVGGILTLVPVLGLTLLVLAGRRLSWRAIGVAAAATIGVLALSIGVDLLRPGDSRTHLGRLVTNIHHDGAGVFATTVARKLATNFRTFTSPWSWSVVVVALYLIFVLAWTRGWRDVLPSRSALRAGVVGTLAAGLLGYAVNDSGVVVTAVVFVYLGPLLTLLALARERADALLPHPALAMAVRAA